MQLEMLSDYRYVPTSEVDPIRYYRLPLVGAMYRRRVARTLSLLPPGFRVLEIGYGSGVSFLNLSRKFDEIHGIDIHDRSVDVEATFRKTGMTLHLRQGSIVNLPFDDNSFDAAVAISIHEELPHEDQRAAFAEVRRVVQPGGCYVVGVPGVNLAMTTAFYLLGCNIRKHHVTTDRQVEDAMAEAFELDRVCRNPSPLPRCMAMYVSMRGWKR